DSGSGHGSFGIEANPVVGDREAEMAIALLEVNSGPGGVRMLGGILEGLEAAEIDGRLDVGVVAGDAVGRHLGMRAQGVQQSALVKSRWIDALGKVAQGLQRLRGLRLEF